MYTTSIILMLSWPVFIIISYQAVKLVLKKYESKLETGEDTE